MHSVSQVACHPASAPPPHLISRAAACLCLLSTALALTPASAAADALCRQHAVCARRDPDASRPAAANARVVLGHAALLHAAHAHRVLRGAGLDDGLLAVRFRGAWAAEPSRMHACMRPPALCLPLAAGLCACSLTAFHAVVPCSVGDVGLGRYLLLFTLYMASVEFFVYWQHRMLHWGAGYRWVGGRAGRHAAPSPLCRQPRGVPLHPCPLPPTTHDPPRRLSSDPPMLPPAPPPLPSPRPTLTPGGCTTSTTSTTRATR